MILTLLLTLPVYLAGCNDRSNYDPQAELDRQGREQAQAERTTKFPADNSYQLQLSMIRDGKEDMATADIQEIFLRVFQSKMGNTGLNPERGAHAGGGEKGIIKVALTAQQTEFGSGGKRVFVPTEFDIEMVVSTTNGSCGWDGKHKLTAEKSSPGNVRGTAQREAQITSLVEDLVKQLPAF